MVADGDASALGNLFESGLGRTMRTCLSVVLLLLLGSCGGERAVDPTPVVGITVPCALAGATAFDSACRVVRTAVGGRTILTLNAPDGGFRRVEVAPNGSGIAAADGALPARTRTGGAGGMEIAIAQDRYRLPAAP